MTIDRLPKYSIVEVEVVGHHRFGLSVRMRHGVRGYVDSDQIADSAVLVEEWPSVGRHVLAVLLGYARDGRMRLSMRPRDMALVNSVVDAEGAFSEWLTVKNADASRDDVRLRFYASEDAVPILRWAIANPNSSSDWELASALLQDAPENIVRDIGGIGR